jgi:cytochrome c oxidase assembly protein subunit 15
MTTDFASEPAKDRVIPPVLVYGFGTSVALWMAWFATHLPWVGASETTKMGCLFGVWAVGSVCAGAGSPRSKWWQVGLGSGLTTSLIGLLLLGAKLAPPKDANPDPARPSAALIVLGFLATGAAIGLVGSGLGRLLFRRDAQSSTADWLHRFAFVTVAALAPLLFVGGLVTSTNSGMAVPDWPRTYGANMFLYPLGNAAVPVFLEHSHRLFGTLVGLTSLVLTIWVFVTEPRKRVRIWAVSVFAAICLQGWFGGGRVILKSPGLAVVHGVVAQFVLSGLVALAVILWATPERAALSQSFGNPRRVRAFTTAALHTVLLQLVFGALYRHLRVDHALWTHVGFSFIVLIAGILGGFWASAVPREAGPLARALRVCGILVVTVVFIQFLLGWAALGMGGRAREAPSVAAALIRTAHQANGALLLGLTTATAVLAKILCRYVAPAAEPKAA